MRGCKCLKGAGEKEGHGQNVITGLNSKPIGGMESDPVTNMSKSSKRRVEVLSSLTCSKPHTVLPMQVRKYK